MLDAAQKSKKKHHSVKHMASKRASKKRRHGSTKALPHLQVWIGVAIGTIAALGLWGWSFQKTAREVQTKESSGLSMEIDYTTELTTQLNSVLKQAKEQFAQIRYIQNSQARSSQDTELSDAQIRVLAEKLKAADIKESEDTNRLPGNKEESKVQSQK